MEHTKLISVLVRWRKLVNGWQVGTLVQSTYRLERRGKHLSSHGLKAFQPPTMFRTKRWRRGNEIDGRKSSDNQTARANL
jgi:hypothetical protein